MSKNNFSDSLVEEYDLFGKVFPFHDELQQAIPQSLKEHFSDDSNGGASLIFLDIGAGYGFTTKLVANEFPKAKFILNEFDGELLSRADAYLETYNHEKKVGDIEEIIKTIPDNSIDAVYTAWVIHNFPPQKRETIFSEIARVLKTNGVLLLWKRLEISANSEQKIFLKQSLIYIHLLQNIIDQIYLLSGSNMICEMRKLI
jgi:ubiquinone/menaquinone biosynthesis C-methylase UbiE